MVAVRDFVSRQLAILVTPPSELERAATLKFFKAGKECNPFVALPMALSAILTSGIALIENPAIGCTRGCALLCQCRIKEGVYTIGAGVLNETRSLFNIFCVFTVAIVGLLPILNPILYGYNPQRFTPKADHTKTISTQDAQTLQSEHQQALTNVQRQNAHLADSLKQIGTVLKLKNDLSQTVLNPQNLKTALDKLAKIPERLAGQKQRINDLQTQVAQRQEAIERLTKDNAALKVERDQATNALATATQKKS